MLKIQEIIQKTRQRKGLSQIELAKLAGITQAMVSKVESRKDVRLSTLDSIAKALGLIVIAVTPEQAFQLRQILNPPERQQNLLEQVQVKDDD